MSKPTQEQKLYASFIVAMEAKWTPHEGQKEVLDDLILFGKDTVFVDCGRKWGKTEVCLAFLGHICMKYKDAVCYYVCHTKDNGKDILWEDPRIKNFFPREFMRDRRPFMESTLSAHFVNGSQIKIIGSNMDVDTKLGVRPRAIVYDEYRKHKTAFDEGMDPNRGVYGAPLLIISTPPEKSKVESGECQFYADRKKECEELSYCSYFNRPSTDNPHMAKGWFARKKEQLIKKGQLHVWQREFLAQIVYGGNDDHVFPNINQSVLLPHDEVMEHVRRRDKETKLLWTQIYDMSGLTRHGVLFAVLDKEASMVYYLDCVIFEDKKEMYDTKEWDTCQRIAAQLRPGKNYRDWTLINDYGANNFANNVRGQRGFDIQFVSPNKNVITKDKSYNNIRKVFDQNRALVSERAKRFVQDHAGLKINPNTRKVIEKMNELVDCDVYFLQVHEFKISDVVPVDDYSHLSDMEKIMHPVHRAGIKSFGKKDNLNGLKKKLRRAPKWWKR